MSYRLRKHRAPRHPFYGRQAHRRGAFVRLRTVGRRGRAGARRLAFGAGGVVGAGSLAVVLQMGPVLLAWLQVYAFVLDMAAENLLTQV